MRAGGPCDCAVDTASASFGAQTFWGRQGPVFLALHFPHGPGVYISLSKLPTGFSVIFKLGKVREILVSFISGKVPLYCPSVQSKTTGRLWALFQEQSSPGMYLFVRGGIIIGQPQKQYVLLPVPFQVFVLVLLCFQLQELTSARILGDTEKVEVISVLWKFMLIFGEMTLTVMKNKHSRIVHNITLCGSNLSTVGIGVLGVFWCARSSLLCVDFLVVMSN